MSKKKAGGSVKNGRESNSKRLGVKIFGGEKVNPGNIIVRQRGLKFHSGLNTDFGKDYTIFSLKNGFVEFYKKNNKKYIRVV